MAYSLIVRTLVLVAPMVYHTCRSVRTYSPTTRIPLLPLLSLYPLTTPDTLLLSPLVAPAILAAENILTRIRVPPEVDVGAM
jgi:hypothetical protein